MTYGVVRAFQVIVNTLLCSPEKAGVGGSTPSLHHISKHLTQICNFPSVRSQSAFANSRAQNRVQHCTLSRHTIFTHAVGVKLKRRLDIAVTQVMKAEPARVILYQLTFFVRVR